MGSACVKPSSEAAKSPAPAKFENQTAGHGKILQGHNPGSILKPAHKAEMEFYTHLKDYPEGTTT
jgi:hypothetical protein